ncbi:MAG: hypothetical protein K6G65_00380 [Lachnospiraceae bacterium]|nr:hypothetical protein [Lachnospiraceae bacterium]
MKKVLIIFVLVLLTVFILLGGAFVLDWVLSNQGEQNRKVIAEDGVIVEGEELWEEFLQATYRQENAQITVSIGRKDSYNVMISYDGEVYRYYEEGIKKSLYESKYLLDLSGKPKGAKSKLRYIIFANEPYTFDEVAASILDENYDSDIDFYFVFK